MKVKLVNRANAPGLIDPQTMRSPFLELDPATGKPTGNVVDVVDVPDNIFWNRRVLAGELTRVTAEPTGLEPVKPLTTR